MSEQADQERIEIYLDTTPSEPKSDEAREAIRQRLRRAFEDHLEASVERYWDLPAIIVQQPRNEYLFLLREARTQYVNGFFYSCVAMCGIVGERLVKDVFRASVLVERNGRSERPDENAFDQIERVEVSALTNFLWKSSLLSDDAASAAKKLGELRNSYAHARGKNPAVSVFKDFVIGDGKLVRRTPPATPSN